MADTDMRARIAERIAARALDLPVFPDATAQLMALSARDDCDLRQVGEHIRRDPALVAHLLRIANSPVFSPRAPIVSLQQALSRLGLAQIRQIVMLVTSQTRAFSVRSREGRVRALFRHAVVSALFAQETARLRRWNVEEAFLIGLFHDVGQPVLLQAIADAEHAIGTQATPALIDALVAEHHADVGATVVAALSLPDRIVEAIRDHHAPPTALAPSHGAVLASFADALAHAAEKPDEDIEAATAALHDHPMVVPLNLYPEDVEALMARRAEILAGARSLA